MVSYLMTGLAVVVVAIAIITRPIDPQSLSGAQTSASSLENEDVLSIKTDDSSENNENMDESTPQPTATVTPTAIPVPTVTATATPTPIKTPSLDFSSQNQWVYPGSSGNPAKYVVKSSTVEVTSWYKNKFKEMGFRTTSAIETRTNGNVLNKLVASSGTTTVSVEIKSSDNGETEYSLQIKSASDQI